MSMNPSDGLSWGQGWGLLLNHYVDGMFFNINSDKNLCIFLAVFLGSQPGNEVGLVAFCLVGICSSTPMLLGKASQRRMRWKKRR